MNDVNTGYKLIALVAVAVAIYSCTSPAVPQGDNSAQLAALQASITQLQKQVQGLSKQGNSQGNSARPCSTQDFLGGKCAAGQLPDAVSVTTTYCTGQGWGLQLGVGYGVQAQIEAELGGGWPEVAWGKLTGKVTGPIPIPVPVAGGLTVPVPLPNNFSAAGSANLGRNLNICVAVPIAPNAAQSAQIADLVRGVNIQSGSQAKYLRRTNRVLNYAALRTPIATVRYSAPGVLQPSGTALATSATSASSDDAFDVSENALQEFMANGFQPTTQATGVLADPIFRDLGSSLPIPSQLADEISDPQRVFDTIRQVTVSNACATYGIDASVRAGHPYMDTLCKDIARLPNEQSVKNMASKVGSTLNRVNQTLTGSGLQKFICNNVTLRVRAVANCLGWDLGL